MANPRSGSTGYRLLRGVANGACRVWWVWWVHIEIQKTKLPHRIAQPPSPGSNHWTMLGRRNKSPPRSRARHGGLHHPRPERIILVSHPPPPTLQRRSISTRHEARQHAPRPPTQSGTNLAQPPRIGHQPRPGPARPQTLAVAHNATLAVIILAKSDHCTAKGQIKKLGLSETSPFRKGQIKNPRMTRDG